MPKNPFPSKKVSWWVGGVGGWVGWGGAKMILMSAPFPFLTLLTKRNDWVVMDWVWNGLGMGPELDNYIVKCDHVDSSYLCEHL